MVVVAMKHMDSNFAKLDKFEEVNFRRWHKKIHFLLSSMSVVYVLITPILEDGGNNLTVEQVRKRAKMLNLPKNYRIPWRPNKWMRMHQSFSDKPKSNNVDGPSVVNMVEYNNSSRYNDNKGERIHHDNIRADPNKKAKPTCWKCGKTGHIKRDCKGVNVGNKANGSGTKGLVDGSSNSLKGATFHVYKDRCWFKTYESLNDGSILHMGNESTALVHGHGCVDLKVSSRKTISLFNVLHVLNIRKNLVSSSILNNYDWVMFNIRGCKIISKDGLIPAFDMDTKKCKTCMLTKITQKPFQNVKRETEVLELIHNDLCDLHATPSLGDKKYFVTFINDALRDAIFDENRFSSVPKPSQRSLIDGTENFGGLVVPKEVTKEVVQQPELELRKSKRNKTPKDFRPEFQLYLIEGIRDEVSDQHSYCFNVEDDPKTFDKAIKSQDVAL
ncbi:zinc finger, CCHC-type containing protein [Tanacetum coccineum]